VLMLASSRASYAPDWNMLDDDELRELSIVMSTLGTVDDGLVEVPSPSSSRACRPSGALMGNYDATDRCCSILGPSAFGGIMEEIRGPAGRNMWEKLSNVSGKGGARHYLKNALPADHRVLLVKLRRSMPRRALAHPAGDLGSRRGSTAC